MLEFHEGGATFGEAVRGAGASAVSGECAVQSGGLGGGLDALSDLSGAQSEEGRLGVADGGFDGPKRLYGGAGKVGDVGLAAFRIGFGGSTDVESSAAVGFEGHVFPRKPCGFTSSEQRIAHGAHEGDVGASSLARGGRGFGVSAASGAGQQGGGFYGGDGGLGEGGGLLRRMWPLSAQSPQGSPHARVLGRRGQAGFVEGTAQGGGGLCAPAVAFCAAGAGQVVGHFYGCGTEQLLLEPGFEGLLVQGVDAAGFRRVGVAQGPLGGFADVGGGRKGS